MDRLRVGVGLVALAVAVAMLGVAFHTAYEVARNPSSGIPGFRSGVNLTVTGPNASFSWSSQGYNVTFSETSTDSGSTLTGWVWDFGDGSRNYVGETPPAHVYATTCVSCTYQVSLAITDAAGHQSVATANVLVQRTGTSNGVGQSPASSVPFPDLGPLSSGLVAALELVSVLLLFGLAAAGAAWGLLRREPDAVTVPVETPT